MYSAFPGNCSVSYLSFVNGKSLWAELNGGENSLHWKTNMLPLFSIMTLWNKNKFTLCHEACFTKASKIKLSHSVCETSMPTCNIEHMSYHSNHTTQEQVPEILKTDSSEVLPRKVDNEGRTRGLNRGPPRRQSPSRKPSTVASSTDRYSEGLPGLHANRGLHCHGNSAEVGAE